MQSTSTSSCRRDQTHQWISQSVTYYNQVQQTVSRHQQTLQELLNTLKSLVNQSQLLTKICISSSDALTQLSSKGITPCTIVVCGLVKAGKSSLVNEILRDEIHLPDDDFLATLRFTVVKYGERDVARLMLKGEILDEKEFEDGEPPDDFIKGKTIDERRQDEAAIRQHVEIDVNYELLKCGLRIIDTPGLDEDKKINSTFYDLIKEIRPTLVIFVFDALMTFGENVIKYCDLLLKILNSLKYPYSFMIAANKIDGNDEANRRDRKPISLTGFKFDPILYEKIIEINFPKFIDKIKVHGTSPHVMQSHREAPHYQYKSHIVRFQVEFERDIAEKVKDATLEIIEENVSLVEPLCHDVGKLLTSITQNHEVLEKERFILTNLVLSDQLKSLHTNLLNSFIQQFEVNWEPFNNYRRDLLNLCKKDNEYVLCERHISNAIEYLVDRAINVIAYIVSKIFIHPSRKEQLNSFTNLCQQYLPMSACHKQCILETLVKQDKLVSIRQECLKIIQEKMLIVSNGNLSNFSVEVFIEKLCSTSLCLSKEMGNFVGEKMLKEVDVLNENICIWSKGITQNADQLYSSMETLNSMKTVLESIHTEFLSMKACQPIFRSIPHYLSRMSI